MKWLPIACLQLRLCHYFVSSRAVGWKVQLCGSQHVFFICENSGNLLEIEDLPLFPIEFGVLDSRELHIAT